MIFAISLFLISMSICVIKAEVEPIKWRINLPENMENSGQQTTTEKSSYQFTQFTKPSSGLDPQQQSSKIRLVDWREWSRMRPAYSATIGAPPLLIVDTDTALDDQHTKQEKSSIPEVEDVELTAMPETTTSSSTTTTTTSISSTSTTTIEPPETTTLDDSSNDSSSTIAPSTSSKTPDVTLELKNLPDMLTLLKGLSLIPSVVRSFSNAAGGSASSGGQDSGASSNPFGSIISAATQQNSFNDLKSRALSANSGYSARAPQFIAAPSTDSEIPQTFFGRRPQSPQQSLTSNLPNMPAPIVPINKKQEAMKPREISYFPPSSQRLNIYGIDPKTSMTMGSSGGSVLVDRDPTSYNAPMTQPPLEQGQGERRQRPRFDLSNLTVNEVEQLESIHRKLFQHPANSGNQSQGKMKVEDRKMDERKEVSGGNRGEGQQNQQPAPLPLTEQQNSLFIFQKPQQTNKAENAHNPSAAELMLTSSSSIQTPSSLKPEMIDELMMIKDIPDLEELTKGMDLSLLSKPGGFAVLKQQFIERLIQRSLVQKRRRWMAMRRRKAMNRNRMN